MYNSLFVKTSKQNTIFKFFKNNTLGIMQVSWQGYLILLLN